MRLQLDTPIINASGILSYIDVFERLEKMGAAFGGYVTKSVGVPLREGNKNPIFYEDYNSVGLSNQGLKAWTDEISDSRLKKPLIVSIFGFELGEYETVLSTLESSVPTKFAAVEYNLSCPNQTPGDKGSLAARFGDSPELVKEIISTGRKLTRKPIIAKISPQCDIKRMPEAAVDAGADYIACSNTWWPMEVKDSKGRTVLAGKTGGRSGPTVIVANLILVGEVYQAVGKSAGIIAYGGIESARDIIDYYKAGASICGIGTGIKNMGDTQGIVDCTKKIWSETKRYLNKNNMTLEKLRGTAHV
jgi:dihydroorotate dehydrogenase subfamily 1